MNQKLLEGLREQASVPMQDELFNESQHFNITTYTRLVVEECIKAITERKVGFPGVHTTFDQGLADHVVAEVVQDIRNHFKDKS